MRFTAKDIRRIDDALRSVAEDGLERYVCLDYSKVCIVEHDGTLLDAYRKPMSLPDNVEELRLEYQREMDTAEFVRELNKAVRRYTETAGRYIRAGADDLEDIYLAVDMLNDAAKRLDSEIDAL